jgi:hypothetical protein
MSGCSQSQNRVVTGHNTLCRHLHLMGLRDSPLCRKCGAEDETPALILRRCEALASIRHAHLGSFFLESENIKTWGPSGALARLQGSCEGMIGAQRAGSYKAYVHQGRKALNPLPIYPSINPKSCDISGTY